MNAVRTLTPADMFAMSAPAATMESDGDLIAGCIDAAIEAALIVISAQLPSQLHNGERAYLRAELELGRGSLEVALDSLLTKREDERALSMADGDDV